MTGRTAQAGADPAKLLDLASAATPAADDLRRAARRAFDAVESWNGSAPSGYRVASSAALGPGQVGRMLEEVDALAGRVGRAFGDADAMGLPRHTFTIESSPWAGAGALVGRQGWDDVLRARLAIGGVAVEHLSGWPLDVLARVGLDGTLPPEARDVANRAALLAMIEEDASRTATVGMPMLQPGEAAAIWQVLDTSHITDPARPGQLLPVRVLRVLPPARLDHRSEVVLSVGDLAQADAIAHWMPGTTHGIHTAMAELGTASDLLAAVAAVTAGAPLRTAVLIDLYDAPDHLGEAALPGLGNRHAPAAQAAVADAAAIAPEARITVIGHSYGSFAAGRAAAAGLDANAVVLLASPGTGTSTAADMMPLRVTDRLCMPADGVFVARAPWDPIVIPADTDEGVNWLVSAPTGGITKPFFDWLPVQPGAKASLGTDPADADFGAVSLEVNDVSTLPGSPGWVQGHSGYLDPGTRILANVANVIAGIGPSMPAPFDVEARVGHVDLPGPGFTDRVIADRTRGITMGTDGTPE